jgi:hypothetical protein
VFFLTENNEQLHIINKARYTTYYKYNILLFITKKIEISPYLFCKIFIGNEEINNLAHNYNLLEVTQFFGAELNLYLINLTFDIFIFIFEYLKSSIKNLSISSIPMFANYY